MTLDEFRQMWEADGCRFVEEERTARGDVVWLLYSIIEAASTSDYGRHYAVMVVVNGRQEIVAHNIKNISSAQDGPWRRQVEAWWREHLAEGLIDEVGKPIAVG